MVITIDPYRIAYMALPKAACSSVKAALADLDPRVEIAHLPETEVGADRFHTLYPTRRFRPHRWENYDTGWFRFCVLRDPLQRILSCYTHRVVELGELHNSRKIKDGRANLPKDPDPDFFFQNLPAYRDASSSVKHHTLPAWLFVGPSLAAYNRIYTTGHLDWLADDLSERAQKDIRIPHQNRSEYRLGLSDLSAQTHDCLNRYLEPEYAFLVNYFRSPLRRRRVAA